MTWPRIGFGCSPYRAGGRRIDLEAAVQVAARSGYRLFDVAEMYGNEGAVGRALRASGVPRSELHVVGKAWRTSFRPDRLRAACEASLRRLELSHFDAYLLHAPEAWQHVAVLEAPETLGWQEFERRVMPRTATGGPALDSVPLAETWSAMVDLRRAGLALRIGVSNFGVAELERLGGIDPEINQIACSPFRPERDTLIWCAARGATVLAHSPLSVDGLLAHAVVHSLAESRGVPAAHLVLAWHLQRGTVPLPSSADPVHVEENLGSLDLVLDEPALEALDALGSMGLTLPEGGP